MLSSTSLSASNSSVQRQASFLWPDVPPYRGAREGYKWPQICKFGGRPKRPKGIPYELMVDSVLNSGLLPEEMANGKDVFAAYSERSSSIEEGDTKRKLPDETDQVQECTLFHPTFCPVDMVQLTLTLH